MKTRKSSQPLPRLGSSTADELYMAVGIALSWWEASEDILLGLFKQLCGTCEPVAMESYVQAPRNVRTSMLKFAMETYASRFTEGEPEIISEAIKKLDRLAATRNEIAHGHCSEFSAMIDGETAASGHYLLPSLNEGNFHERSFRFHHVAETIEAFTTEVRKHRGRVMDVWLALITRDSGASTAKSKLIVAMTNRIARGEIVGQAAVDELTQMFGLIDAHLSLDEPEA